MLPGASGSPPSSSRGALRPCRHRGRVCPSPRWLSAYSRFPRRMPSESATPARPIAMPVFSWSGFPLRFVQRDFFRPALGFIESARNKVKGVRTQAHGVFGYQNPRHALGEPLDPARHVHRIAYCSVFAPLLGTDQANNRRSGVNADADIEIRIRMGEILAEGLQRIRHLQSSLDGMFGIPGVVERRAPDRHDAIADELVQRAAIAEDHFDLPAEIAIEQADDFLRRARFGEGCETAYVGKQQGDLAALAFARKPAMRDQFLDDMRIDETRKLPDGLLALIPLAQLFLQRRHEKKHPREQELAQHAKHQELADRPILR